ncbi:hypothetical protein BDM02DRAFT_377474 [Thelephora ganbajun]|uniref:Uncharacterized protein n=1 Tax=Thelephora ganbajun TaxID=370292 RepID=A0ACB6Z8E7_THEGA|nr:hypothetical protein BDM02DRAFT_377474 [Thelephora ganbajun]
MRQLHTNLLWQVVLVRLRSFTFNGWRNEILPSSLRLQFPCIAYVDPDQWQKLYDPAMKRLFCDFLAPVGMQVVPQDPAPIRRTSINPITIPCVDKRQERVPGAASPRQPWRVRYFSLSLFLQGNPNERQDGSTEGAAIQAIARTSNTNAILFIKLLFSHESRMAAHLY